MKKTTIFIVFFEVKYEKIFCTIDGRLIYPIKSDPLILFNEAKKYY